MKRHIATFTFIGALVAALAFAQSTSDVVEVSRDDIQTGRKEILSNTMEFTEAEGASFWPVYNTYRAEIRKVDDRLVKLITDYASAGASLTDEQAKTMVKEFLSVRQAKDKIAAGYVDKFMKVLPPKKVARFYQVENRMDLILQAAAASEIPLVK
jgi:predicted nucleotidyltransferase